MFNQCMKIVASLTMLMVSQRKCLCFTYLNEAIVAMEFQNDGLPSTKSFMKFKRQVPETTKLTICFRAKIIQLRTLIPIVSYSTPDFDNEFIIGLESQSVYLGCCNDSKYQINIPLKYEFLEWLSLCVAFDTSQMKIFLFQDVMKQEFGIDPDDSNTGNITIRGNGKLYMGQEQDTFGGGFNHDQSLRGSIADMHVFIDIPNEEVLFKYVKCIGINVSSFLNFSDVPMNFQLSNVVTTLINISSICFQDTKRVLLMSELRTYSEAEKACENVGGEIYVPKNDVDNWNLFYLAASYTEECHRSNSDIIWIGAYSKCNDTAVRDFKTNEPLNYTYIIGSRSFCSDICIRMYSIYEDSSQWYAGWTYKSCLNDACTPCLIKQPRIIHLRGLCSKSFFDKAYFIVKENKTTLFYGTHYCSIISLPGRLSSPNDYGYWQISHYHMKEVKARTKKLAPASLPTGRQVWEIENDRCGVTEAELSLTICKEGEFSCTDGSCIPLKKRCDWETNCDDGSDEIICSPLILPPRYPKTIPPPRNAESDPVEVILNFIIYSIRSFDLSSFSFSIDASLKTSWIDSRVRFQNLKDSSTLNKISVKETEPWTPKFEYVGGGNTVADVNVRHTILAVRREDDPLEDWNENVREDEIFLGSENPLVMEQKLTITSVCQFNLQLFPFDTQRCDIVVLMTGSTNIYAVIKADENSVSFSGQRRLLEYFVSSVYNANITEGLFSGTRITVIFQNLFTYYLISTFIPTLVMLIIGGCPFFFPLDDFNERIMIALTSLLVQAALFGQVSESIPKTAYFKYIDIWFIFCILSLFAVNLALTIIHRVHYNCHSDELSVSKNSGFKKKQRKYFLQEKLLASYTLNRKFQCWFPIGVFTFVLCYSGTAIFIYRE